MWLIAGVILGALGWVLLVPLSPTPFQASPGTAADRYRASGLVPKPGAFHISAELGHEVFEVPATDAEHFAAAEASGSGMQGMDMDAMVDDAQEGDQAPNMAMPQASDGDARDHTPEHGEAAPQGMAMEGKGEHAGGFGLMPLPDRMAHMAERTIEIDMAEWGFTPAKISVAAGQTVRFIVRNAGNLPHEFMFMPATGMMAVNYRLERADWNLTEHEAIFERAVVLPGDSFEVTLKIEGPGTWMYMCMFPYHMQFGMMGVLATEGAPASNSMEMGGDMKM